MSVDQALSATGWGTPSLTYISWKEKRQHYHWATRLSNHDGWVGGCESFNGTELQCAPSCWLCTTKLWCAPWCRRGNGQPVCRHFCSAGGSPYMAHSAQVDPSILIGWHFPGGFAENKLKWCTGSGHRIWDFSGSQGRDKSRLTMQFCTDVHFGGTQCSVVLIRWGTRWLILYWYWVKTGLHSTWHWVKPNFTLDETWV